MLKFCPSIYVHFRAQHDSHDVWSMLERNWADFFWLTGKTPNTLSSLVNKLEDIYTQNYWMRRGLLDFRNKVQFSVNNSVLIFQNGIA